MADEEADRGLPIEKLRRESLKKRMFGGWLIRSCEKCSQTKRCWKIAHGKALKKTFGEEDG